MAHRLPILRKQHQLLLLINLKQSIPMNINETESTLTILKRDEVIEVELQPKVAFEAYINTLSETEIDLFETVSGIAYEEYAEVYAVQVEEGKKAVESYRAYAKHVTTFQSYFLEELQEYDGNIKLLASYLSKLVDEFSQEVYSAY